MGYDPHLCCQSHCCVLHGCKYMEDGCPVVSKKVDQDYPCEYCQEIGIESVEVVKLMEAGLVALCYNCGAPHKKGDGTVQTIRS